MDKMLLSFFATAVVATSASGLERADAISALGDRMLPNGYSHLSHTVVYNAVNERDAKADEAWRKLKSQSQYDAYRGEMRERFIAAIGGFPEKTALNGRVVGKVARKGYVVEKVIFESMPGAFVTALLYLPDNPKFKPPYRAFLVTCGHSDNGKGSDGYQRACVLGAEAGFASLIYDPIAQGERMQVPETSNVFGHNRLGILAALVGKSMARFRIWDGMRAMDYLDSRADIIHGAYGYMGNSGGGTMTSLIMAIDPRVKAAAPCCYLSSIRSVYSHCGPQDAEQNIYGQLTFGLNHASFVLMGGNAVRMSCCQNDFFPFEGSMETWRTVREAAANLGFSRYGLTDVAGPHGWKESVRAVSVRWMRRHLAGDEAAGEIDMDSFRRLDLGFDIAKVDSGLCNPKKCREGSYEVTPNGKVSELPGFRSAYEFVRDDLKAALAARKTRSNEELARIVSERAVIRKDGCRADCVELSRVDKGEASIVRRVFRFPNGIAVPSVTLEPKSGERKPAVLLVGDSQRTNLVDAAMAKFAQGHPVMVADLIGAGEIGKPKNGFYRSANGDEEVAVMLYALGRSLVGIRAEEMLALGAFLKGAHGAAPSLVADGRMAIPAAHARAVDRAIFAGVETHNAPLGWTQAVNLSANYCFANIVNGALLEYDWTDLLK